MDQIEKRRTELAMTQSKLAKLLGVDRSTVAKWEAGQSRPRADKLPELAQILE